MSNEHNGLTWCHKSIIEYRLGYYSRYEDAGSYL